MPKNLLSIGVQKETFNMQIYVSQPADGENSGKYEVAVWDESKNQYVSQGGPYYLTEEASKAEAKRLNKECNE